MINQLKLDMPYPSQFLFKYTFYVFSAVTNIHTDINTKSKCIISFETNTSSNVLVIKHNCTKPLGLSTYCSFGIITSHQSNSQHDVGENKLYSEWAKVDVIDSVSFSFSLLYAEPKETDLCKAGSWLNRSGKFVYQFSPTVSVEGYKNCFWLSEYWLFLISEILTMLDVT